MKKITLLLIASVMLASFACSPSSNGTETADPKTSLAPGNSSTIVSPAPGNNNAISIADVTAFGRNIVSGCSFEYSLDEFDDLVFAADQLHIDNAKLNTINGAPEMFRASTSAGAEEVLVIGAKDEATAKELLEGPVANHVAELREGYSSYGPDQVPKIDSCIKMTSGRYVILVISNDNAAAQTTVNSLLNAANSR